MTDDIIIEKAIQEIETKTWGVTEQFLEVHEIAYANGKPVIAGIDKSRDDGAVLVYIAVKGQPFYFMIVFSTLPAISITGVGTSPDSRVDFGATSKEMSFVELSALTKLQPVTGWNKGDVRKSGKTFHTFSCVIIQTERGPGTFEDKLKKLLDILEQDKAGILKLAVEASGGISVAIQYHNGNGMLGGPHIDKESMKRMATLNLSADIDLYACGTPFKDNDDNV